MITVPGDGVIVCRLLNEKENYVSESGITYLKQELPLYEVLAVGKLDFKMLSLKPHDVIVINSIPTKVVLASDNVQWLVHQENVVGKVEV